MTDYLASLIRTGVAIAVGYVVALAARHGWNIDSTQATAQITAAAIGVYYAVVRWAETKWPAVGWMLGLAKAPTYPKPPT